MLDGVEVAVAGGAESINLILNDHAEEQCLDPMRIERPLLARSGHSTGLATSAKCQNGYHNNWPRARPRLLDGFQPYGGIVERRAAVRWNRVATYQCIDASLF